MTLLKIAVALDDPNQKVVCKDHKSGRIRFNGTADQLLDWKGLDYCYLRTITVKDNVLVLNIRSF